MIGAIGRDDFQEWQWAQDRFEVVWPACRGREEFAEICAQSMGLHHFCGGMGAGKAGYAHFTRRADHGFVNDGLHQELCTRIHGLFRFFRAQDSARTHDQITAP